MHISDPSARICRADDAEAEPYALTITVEGTGTVTTSGPDEPPEPGEQFDVTLTASWSDATHEFVGWGGDCSGTTAMCVLTIDGDKSVTAALRELVPDS